METRNAIEGAVHPSETQEQSRVDTLINQRMGPGMVVLAPPMRVLHINQHAWELIRRITHGKDGNGDSKRTMGLLPMSIRQIGAEIFCTLRERNQAKDWERFEIKHVLSASNQQVLVRGFGVPDRNGRGYSRAVLLLEAMGRRKEALNGETTLRRQLTEREQAVLQCLANGWTNKEIASALSLALPTVKEHIRHIMDKTSTTTRTGILAQVFRTGGPTPR